MSILVYVENTDGKFKKSAFEVVSYAKSISNQINTPVVALSIGQVQPESLAELAQYGADKIITANTDQVAQFINRAYAHIIAEVTKQEGASIVVLSNSFSGKGLAPRLATKLKAALADGATSLPEIEGDKFIITKSAFSGKAIAKLALHADIKVIALNPNAFEPQKNEVPVEIVEFNPELAAADLSVIIQDIVRATDKISLPEAEIVVSAGRGLKGPENWAIIEELAEVLGAATACSKPVSDAGWRPHSEHVGQTGIVVSPNLYIAIGISGAIQHLAGVSSSKTIVVINKDPEAPFFKVADYGIVGDAFEVVPQLIAALKTYKGN